MNLLKTISSFIFTFACTFGSGVFAAETPETTRRDAADPPSAITDGSSDPKSIESFVKPTTVTYRGTLNGADALIEIMEQSGNVLVLEKAPSEDIEIDFQETPFWESLDYVLDELNLDADPFTDTPGLKLVSSADGTTGPSRVGSKLRSLRGAYEGVFRFEPTQISSTRSLERIGSNSLSIDLQVAWEPRLKPIFCRFPMKYLSAECDNGEILQASSPDASPEYTPSGTHAIQADLQLMAPSRNAKVIKRLQGSIEAMIPGGIVAVQFDDLQKPGIKTKVIGKLKVSLEEVQLREDILEVNLLVSVEDAGESMDSFRGWIMNNECFVQEPESEPMKFAGFQTYKMNGSEVGMTYFFDLGSKKKFEAGSTIDRYQLIYKAPGAAIATQVDFQLLDIPLP